MAYWAVRSKNFEQHREWMIRSFTVTCAFSAIRLANKILTDQFHVDDQVANDFLAWAGWALPLIVVEAFLQGSKIRKGNSDNFHVVETFLSSERNELKENKF